MIPEKTLPQKVETEESVITSIFINPEDFKTVNEILKPGDFYKTSHQIIFEVMVRLKRKKRNIDLQEVYNELENVGRLEEIGGAASIAKMISDVPFSTNIKGHCEIILQASTARKTLAAAYDIIQKCYDPNGDDPLIYAQSSIMNIESGHATDSIIDLKSLLEQRIEQIEEITTTEQMCGIRLGFPAFDSLINITGPRLIIIAARPSMGKTALMMTWARNIAKGLVKVGVIELEMDKEQLADRMISSSTEINTMRLTQYNQLTKKDWEKINDHSEMLSELPILIDDEGPAGIEDVERKCRKMKSMGAEVIFIDQLSKISPKRGQTATEAYSEHTNRIAELKKELKLPIFLLSQLNRDVEKRADREPMLSDLKQTGSLEEDADLIFFLMRPEVYITDSEKKKAFDGVTILNLAKHRQGAIYRTAKKIKFVKKTTTFWQDMEEEDE